MNPNKSWGYIYQTAWGCICMKSFTLRFQFFLAFFDTFEATRRHWMDLPGGSVFCAGRNYECCKQPGGGSRTHRWFLGDVGLGCGFGMPCRFWFHLIQVPNFQQFSWNRIYPEAPLPKKLTAFGNLEDVKPPCQLLRITATLIFLPLLKARPTCWSVLNQLLSRSWGRCCRCDGLMMGDGRKDGGGISPLDMLGTRNPKWRYSKGCWNVQCFISTRKRRPQSQVQMYRTKLEIIRASLYGVWWHGTGNAVTWKRNGLVFWLMIGSDWSSAVQQGIDNLTVVSYHFSFYGKEAGAQRYVATIKSCCAQFDAVIGREFWEVVVMANIRTRWSLFSFESSFDFVEIEPGSQSLRTTHFLLWRPCYMHGQFLEVSVTVGIELLHQLFRHPYFVVDWNWIRRVKTNLWNYWGWMFINVVFLPFRTRKRSVLDVREAPTSWWFYITSRPISLEMVQLEMYPFLFWMIDI